MYFCIAGKNDIAVRALEYLICSKIVPKNNILVCPVESDTGQDTWQLSLQKYASTHNINIVRLEDLYKFDDLLFLSLEFDKIINPFLFKSQKLFNIHFSKLPKYKGMYTSVWPILNGEYESGVTLHRIDSGIDTGDIIAQDSFRIDISDTARTLYSKYLEHGFNLFKDNYKSLLNNNFITKPQGYHDSTYFSKKSLDFKNIKINLNKTSFEIHNQIRAFIFPEYQLPVLNGYKIIKSTLTDEKISYKYYLQDGKNIILSGIDGFKLLLEIYD